MFRARNYEKAARSVRGWADDISQLDVKALRAIPGVGASIAAKIAEYRETGSIRALDEPYGVGTAQRGWLTSGDVINTWPLDRLRAFLRKGR